MWKRSVPAGRTCQKSFPEGCHFLLDEKSSCSRGRARGKPWCYQLLQLAPDRKPGYRILNRQRQEFIRRQTKSRKFRFQTPSPSLHSCTLFWLCVLLIHMNFSCSGYYFLIRHNLQTFSMHCLFNFSVYFLRQEFAMYL